jgi:hypothetical protein
MHPGLPAYPHRQLWALHLQMDGSSRHAKVLCEPSIAVVLDPSEVAHITAIFLPAHYVLPSLLSIRPSPPGRRACLLPPLLLSC